MLRDSASAMGGSLEGAQEVERVLHLRRSESVASSDDPVSLRFPAFMGANRLHQVGRAAIMPEEQTLAETPERCCAELIRPGGGLRDSVRQPPTPMGCNPKSRNRDDT
jgi:hypothetical protein